MTKVFTLLGLYLYLILKEIPAMLYWRFNFKKKRHKSSATDPDPDGSESDYEDTGRFEFESASKVGKSRIHIKEAGSESVSK